MTKGLVGNERAALWMSDVWGMTYPEIAECFGFEQSTIAKWVGRAQADVRKRVITRPPKARR